MTRLSVWTAMLVSATLGAACAPANAQDRLRVAVFDAELRRDGPGVLMRDLTKGEDPQVKAVVEVIAATRPDILALLSFDWDYDGAALAAFGDLLRAAGVNYDHVFSARPNSGLATQVDLDGDGRRGGPGDAQGYGDYTGQNGLAVLSVHPIDAERVQDFSGLLWKDTPAPLLPVTGDGAPFPSTEARAIQRLSSTAHWAVPIDLPDGTRLTLLTFHATPPVFDGPEDRNGRRNHDEVVFWRRYLDGAFGPAPNTRFVLAGGANLDPLDSDGRRAAIQSLLADPRFQDPLPTSKGAQESQTDGKGSITIDATDTVDWTDVGAGRLRVDYVLPSADWTVSASGVFWPETGAPHHDAAQAASRHRLVWVDLILP